MDPRDVPELRPVVARRRFDPAWLVLGVAVALVAVSAWKPWSAPRAHPLALAAPQQATAMASPPTPSPPAIQSPAPDVYAPILGTGLEPLPAGTSPTAIDGIDWSGVGVRDRHEGWGVSFAFLPFDQIDDALVLHWPAIGPSERWLPVDPGWPPGPTVGAHGTPVVALAVTWPAGVAPMDVHLRYVGRVPTHGPWPSLSSAAGSWVTSDEAVPLLLRMAGPRGRQHLGSTAWVPWQLIPGTFFLPPHARAHGIIDWLSQGWAPGRYEFGVQLANGRSVALPFTLDSGV